MRKRSTHCKVCGVALTNLNNRSKMSRAAMCYTHWRENQNVKAKERRALLQTQLGLSSQRRVDAIAKWQPGLKHRLRIVHCKKCGIELTPENNGLQNMGRSAMCYDHWREQKNATFKRWYYKNQLKILTQKRALEGRHGAYYLARRAHSFNGNNGGKFITKEDIESMLAKQLRHCAICNSDLVDKNWEIDHILPKKLGGSHEMSNLEIICHACNRGKWTMTKDQYVVHCRKVFDQDKIKKEKENKSIEV